MAACPLTARAQPGVRRVGMLLVAYTPDDRAGQARVEVFRKSLQALGWGEPRNVSLDTRFGDGSPGRVKALAPELVQSRPMSSWCRATPP